MSSDTPTRHAVLRGQADKVETIRRYLPSNYTADSDGGDVFIHGTDSAGWTLDGYVIPRLASGLYFAEEVFSCVYCGAAVTADHPTLSGGSAYRVGTPPRGQDQFPACSNPAATGHAITAAPVVAEPGLRVGRVVYRCPECGYTATTETDPNEWSFGHDCEV